MTRSHVYLATGFTFLVLGVLSIVGCSPGCTMHDGNWGSSSFTSKDGVELDIEFLD